MKGVVFCELLDWIERCHGVEGLDEVLLDAELPHGGAYTTSGAYDAAEFEAIVRAFAGRTGAGPDEVLRAYGRHLFGAFARNLPDLLGDRSGALDVLEHVQSCIHPEVAKLYPEAELPSFEIEPLGNGIALEYRSTRPLAELARGLIEGCLAHFGEQGSVQVRGDAKRCRFEVTIGAEAR